MLRYIKQHIKKIIFLAIALCFIGSILYSFHKNVSLREKTKFSAQETKTLWSILGMEYVDLDISKAYYNRELFVVSEGFDSIDAEIEYLKQFDGNENIEIVNDPFSPVTSDNYKGQILYEIFNIECTDKGYFRNCYTYEDNGKYYLEFYVPKAGGLYEMFGFND
jgi:hypothetical protein